MFDCVFVLNVVLEVRFLFYLHFIYSCAIFFFAFVFLGSQLMTKK